MAPPADGAAADEAAMVEKSVVEETPKPTTEAENVAGDTAKPTKEAAPPAEGAVVEEGASSEAGVAHVANDTDDEDSLYRELNSHPMMSAP